MYNLWLVALIQQQSSQMAKHKVLSILCMHGAPINQANLVYQPPSALDCPNVYKSLIYLTQKWFKQAQVTNTRSTWLRMGMQSRQAAINMANVDSILKNVWKQISLISFCPSRKRSCRFQLAVGTLYSWVRSKFAIELTERKFLCKLNWKMWNKSPLALLKMLLLPMETCSCSRMVKT